MTVIVEQRPRRSARARARRAPSGPAVVLRMPPPLDPPPEQVGEPATEPALDMDQLPLEWPGAPPLSRAPQPRRPRPAPTPPGPRTSAYAAAQRFVGLCVEILNGYRPASQLRPMSHPQRFADISDQILRRTVRVRMTPGQAARHGHLVRARRLLLSEPLAGVAEAAVVLEHGDATWAMAIRLERTTRPGVGVLGWMCTVVQVV
ncbi:Rv3235 family protein [Dactylosporangium sp. NPDC000555]|uniref:Rv3235 family protein n=1 Tax=Dactylosporangium sp. NPDC000555 TaxID=3154260 RepID=UPI00333321EB